MNKYLTLSSQCRNWLLIHDGKQINVTLSFGSNPNDHGIIDDYDNLNQETNWIYDGYKLNYYAGNRPTGSVIFSIDVSAILSSNSLPHNHLGGSSGMGGSLTVVSTTGCG